jgi:hypothetical protein
MPIPIFSSGEQGKSAFFLSAIDERMEKIGRQLEKVEEWK